MLERSSLSLPVRALLLAFGVLTALAVVALLLGAEHTERAFAWTIVPPMAAAFLGAAYGAGCLLVLLTLRAGTWEQARWPLATVLLFVVVTLVATLLHLDRLHLPGTSGLSTAAAWFWLGVYLGLPPMMAAVLFREERRRSGDAARTRGTGRARQPVLFTWCLLGQGAVLGVVGVALLVGAAPVLERWPWSLTPFVAQVTAAWLVSFAFAAFVAAHVDVTLLGPASASYAAFGALELCAMALHAEDVRAGAAATGFVAVAIWVLLTGAAGAWLAGAGRER
jgi:hypothetical protein